METSRLDILEDNALQIQINDIISGIAGIIPVYDSSHSDLVDNYEMNHAAADSNQKHFQQQQYNQQNVRRIDTTISQVIANDLEILKGHSQEVDNLLKQIMEETEKDCNNSQDKNENKKCIDECKMSVLTTVCSNTMIDRPFVKLLLFSDIIRVRGMHIEKLSQLMTAPKGDKKIWKMLPSLINTSMDILIKLCCSWMLYASLIDLKKMVTNDEGDCLLGSSDPCVLNTINYINNIIKKRRDSSLITLLPGETTVQKKIGNRSIMIENLSEVLIPCLFKIERVLSDM